MRKPREFKFWYNSYAAKWEARQISGPDPEREITVREVMPDDEKGDKYLAMCKYVDLKNEELGRVTRALEKAKSYIPVFGSTKKFEEIEAILTGE